MISIRKLNKSYGSSAIIQDMDLEINKGEIVGIIGPSGTGKSLLLRLIMTLDQPTSGEIYFDGNNITAKGFDSEETRKRIGMVFQNFNLFPHLSAIENVMSGLVDLQGMNKKDAYNLAMKELKSVGLVDRAFYYPSQLSGGQKQRVAIARTVAMQPDLILFDEPTSSLDPTMKGEVEAAIRLLAADGHTMIIVSHEMELIRDICTRVVFVNKGNVYEDGTPEKIFDNPERTGTRRFVRALRVLEFDVASKNFDFIGMQTTINEYTYRNGVAKDLVYRLQAVIEELAQMAIIQTDEENTMHVSVEYNHKEKVLSGVIRYTGVEMDPDDIMYMMSWPLVCRNCTTIEHSIISEGNYTNKVQFTI